MRSRVATPLQRAHVRDAGGGWKERETEMWLRYRDKVMAGVEARVTARGWVGDL